ncbi:unnamed protein product [Microthlaspi erraticum]|uniref:Uncharacterized protein n=1 Tax=Microthlaspi erraticum TaxID=1685480 RepID=A0A6D2JGI8_9BRAS|nr:unnamed protein product [Microthlaspi erraticum]
MNDSDEKNQAPKAKKARATKQHEEPEYFEEKRNLQDLWKAAFPVGAEWKLFDALYEHNWDFKHLEESLEEGGMLYGKKVFVFANAEPQMVHYKDVDKVVPVPTVVAVESPFPPSDKIAIASIQRAAEEIFPMKQMKMDWVPFIPFGNRERQVDRIKFQIFILACTQRRSALRHVKEERARDFEYCLPYFCNPFKEDELEQSSEVQLIFPSEPPVHCEFDWKFDRLEEFVDNLIEGEEISAEQKDEFKDFVKEHARAAKKARKEATAARMKVIEEMSEDDRQAFESIKVYKFYPQPPPEISGLLKAPKINRYYGDAHQVF